MPNESKQVSLEGDVIGYADSDVPVQERAGVPVEVQRDNVADTPPPAREGTPSKADPATQPDVPEDYTAQEVARANALGDQHKAEEQAAGRDVTPGPGTQED